MLDIYQKRFCLVVELICSFPRFQEEDKMNARDIGGALGIVCGAAVIGVAIWVSKSPNPLWAIILLVWFAHDFPWSSNKEEEDTEEEEIE